MIVDNVKVNCNEEINEKEAAEYVNMMKSPEKRLVELDIKIKDDDVLPLRRSPSSVGKISGKKSAESCCHR